MRSARKRMHCMLTTTRDTPLRAVIPAVSRDEESKVPDLNPIQPVMQYLSTVRYVFRLLSVNQGGGRESCRRVIPAVLCRPVLPGEPFPVPSEMAEVAQVRLTER
jgi:hypothetical protein